MKCDTCKMWEATDSDGRYHCNNTDCDEQQFLAMKRARDREFCTCITFAVTLFILIFAIGLASCPPEEEPANEPIVSSEVTTDLSSPYQQGQDAFRWGLSPLDNPYVDISEEWLRGYLDAMEESRANTRR